MAAAGWLRHHLTEAAARKSFFYAGGARARDIGGKLGLFRRN
jgi:hypothetical protein